MSRPRRRPRRRRPRRVTNRHSVQGPERGEAHCSTTPRWWWLAGWMSYAGWGRKRRSRGALGRETMSVGVRTGGCKRRNGTGARSASGGYWRCADGARRRSHYGRLPPLRPPRTARLQGQASQTYPPANPQPRSADGGAPPPPSPSSPSRGRTGTGGEGGTHPAWGGRGAARSPPLPPPDLLAAGGGELLRYRPPPSR